MRTPAARSLRALDARVAALEARVERLERGRPPPGDGRGASLTPGAARRGTERAAGARSRPVVRCTGCGLPLHRRRGRCAECGRPLDG